MKKIETNFQELKDAFESRFDEAGFFLDIQTGEIIFIVDDDFADNKYDKDEIYDNSDRYYEIGPIDSADSYKIMEDFISEVDDEKIKNELINSINKRKPFRNFKDNLKKYPDIEKKYFQFFDIKLEEEVRDWIKNNNLNLDLK